MSVEPVHSFQELARPRPAAALATDPAPLPVQQQNCRSQHRPQHRPHALYESFSPRWSAGRALRGQGAGTRLRLDRCASCTAIYAHCLYLIPPKIGASPAPVGVLECTVMVNVHDAFVARPSRRLREQLFSLLGARFFPGFPQFFFGSPWLCHHGAIIHGVIKFCAFCWKGLYAVISNQAC